MLAGARSVLVLEDLVDHTNVGAVFRSGRGARRRRRAAAPRCADPLYRRSIKVGMGAVFTTPWTACRTGTTPSGAVRAGLHHHRAHPGPDAAPIESAVAGVERLALVLGSEGHGLSSRWEQSADRRAIIAMREGIDSLNVAAAERSRLLTSRLGR